ncbi:hypothetical protein B0T25DRAFT_576233 [Lasiosphaeria hispida]|uniref:Kinetochore protein Sos7 coiled-coil domain-containing protein n=1 Tax=Lasiosphaeria hispida TaxID=260671 RepID=A0AAJ0MKE7_9PEZI|nr:hypothetical protein B0T25DRAFT_576233 [Lasiosphaeria hispida]
MARIPSKPRAAKVLQALEALQSAEITVLKLSEPISTAPPQTNPDTRTSDVSAASLDTPSPASLEADLAHYKELFAKLRFSYVEQVTKEKFIRAIVGDPPLIVTAQENADLEAGNAEAKAALKALKTEVADMVAELEARGRGLAARYERAQRETAALREVPERMAAVEERVRQMKSDEEGGGGRGEPEMNMPLAKTAALVEARRREQRELGRALEQLGAQAPRKRKEVERLRAELAQLEAKRVHSTTAAREAKRRKEDAQGGVEDDLEAKGRWYRATETALNQVLDIQG